MNRAGFVNFWYYDNEVFQFEDGRLLLRGSNGSGKSVTMQSLIPLLLDGNKSPDRLDPFGSRARKIDNYLLDENSELDERTGYIFIEFIKDESNSYITIGLGIRAKKNTPVMSWGFCIVDGRRVGINFSLTKTTIGDIPLTKKELQNRISDGGYVFDSMNEYKEKVNSLLFGYEDIEDYSDLIKLLIQLRSPKLSKDFKPTVLYEIMTNSLQTLSDDDLRPMSEAIESMDTTKIKLENLYGAERACKKINDVYDKYNRVLLFDKSFDYLNFNKSYQNKLDEINRVNNKIQESNRLIDEGKKELEDIDISEKRYKQENESLKLRDEYKLEQEKNEKETILKDKKEKLNKKNELLNRKTGKVKDIEDEIKKYSENFEKCYKEIRAYVKDLQQKSDDIGFSEFEFMCEEFIDNINEQYDFTITKRRFNEYSEKIKKATDLLKIKKEKSEIYKQNEASLDDATKQIEGCERNVKLSEQMLTDIKDEYIEAVNLYSINNQYLKIQRDKLEKISEEIYSYSTEKHFDHIYSIFTECFNEYNSYFNLEILAKEKEVSDKIEEINKLIEKVEKWQNTKDPEPERKEEVINNRNKLDELNIPYIPLYKALEFNNDVNDEYKGTIEESLIELGLLDALIIPEKFKTTVLKLEGDICDKYIFSDPKYLSYELSSMMHIDKSYADVKNGIDEVLKSILLDNTDNSTFISSDGVYGMGILKGRVTGKYKARYIGVSARKQLKEEKIQELTNQINDLNYEKLNLENQLNDLKIKLSILNDEKNKFPSNKDLDIAKNTLKEAYEDLKRSKDVFDKANEKLQLAKEELAKAKEDSYYACEKIYIEPKQYERYITAIDICNDYDKLYSSLIGEHKVYLNNYDYAQGRKVELEEVEYEISEIRVEIRDLGREIIELNDRIDSILEQLKLYDYEAIKSRIQENIRMLDTEIPRLRKLTEKKVYSNENEIKNCNQSLEKLDIERINEKEKLDEATNVFLDEYRLGLIYDYDENIDIKGIANKINSDLEYLKSQRDNFGNISQNLSNVYYQERHSLSEYILSLDNLNNRMVISARQSGKNITFIDLVKQIADSIEIQKQLIKDKDREIFEEILFNNLNKIIRAKIFQSKEWVKEMNDLMESLDTSSGLTFSLRWRGKKADSEEEISTEELVELLEKDPRLLREDDKEKFTAHFKSKIERARNLALDQGESKGFHAIIKELLDYRQWFEFQLYFTKTNEKKKELTNNAFFQFSGGEKAMAMYVPLFSAVSARYSSAEKDCPRIISLDEAFAGVDSKNIRDMFKLLRELKLGFIINSQVLWGDYDTVPRLGISEILRPNNSNVVSIIRYIWNGKSREMVINNG